MNRRVLFRSDEIPPESIRLHKRREKASKTAELDHNPPDALGIKIKQPEAKAKPETKKDPLIRFEIKVRGHENSDSHSAKKKGRRENTTEDTIPISDIQNGIIHMENGRYIKILEVEPINFLLRNPREQRNIIAGFASWMKISPINIQIKVLTKKADISKHLRNLEHDMEHETNEKCRLLQKAKVLTTIT